MSEGFSMTWDNKFGEITKVIEGVGKDAEIVVNEKGGKQSKSPMAMHLIDPMWLRDTIPCIDSAGVFRNIAEFMMEGNIDYIQYAMDCIELSRIEQMIRIAKVLQYGAERYQPNNWRLIPQEEHINHALIHLIAAELGDTQDNHLDHALCRLMMAYATETSSNFKYGAYVG